MNTALELMKLNNCTSRPYKQIKASIGLTDLGLPPYNYLF